MYSNLENGIGDLTCKTEIETDIENGRMDTGGRERYVMNWEIGLDTYPTRYKIDN